MKKVVFLAIATLMFLPKLEGSPSANFVQTPGSFGIASWYSESDPGINRTTANGEVFDDSQSTCASWHFPFNTYLKVTYLKNGRSIVCRVNDRGPSKRLGRLIDLTKTAFKEIAPLKLGLIQVKVEPVSDRVKK